MRLTFLICCAWLVAYAQGKHSCIHNELMQKLGGSAVHQQTIVPDAFNTSAVQNGRRQLLGTYGPIRIFIDDSFLDGDDDFMCTSAGQMYRPTIATTDEANTACKAEDVLTPAKKAYLRNTILAEAISWFQRALSVVPVSGNLRLGNGFSDGSCFSPASSFSAGSYFHTICCDRYLPPSDKSTGKPDTDFVLYVTARPTSGSTIAWALTCQSDSIGRPVAGHANFGPNRMDTSPKEKPLQLSTAIHEIAHALGFSGSKFPDFRKPGTTQRANRNDVIASFSERGHVIQKIITPNVVAKVKQHFGCSNWPNAGAEIEDFGGEGTAGSHWEKRLFNNEFMTGTADPISVYSAVSLALFQDSGWYQVDYSVAEKLEWGAGQGCGFATGKCGDTWNDEYFCRVQNEQGCTLNGRYKARCNLVTSGFNVPAEFRYFPDNPGWGGSSPHHDYCPYYSRLSDGNCLDPDTRTFWYFGESVGSSSRCFTGTFRRSSVNIPEERRSGCFPMRCNLRTSLLEVVLKGSSGETVVPCQASPVDVDLSTIPGSEFVGTFHCPASSKYCSGDPCDSQTCSGHGTCNSADGSCTCNPGYYGATAYECDSQYCPANEASVQCSGHGFCNSDTGVCLAAEGGEQGCETGWRGAACNEKGCPFGRINGLECSGRGNCTTDGACICEAGFVGLDCSYTDCPGNPRCGGTQGTCDTTKGYCTCAETTEVGVGGALTVKHYKGPACATEVDGERELTELVFVGEKDENGTVSQPETGALQAKEFKYYYFKVPNVEYPLILELDFAPASASPVLSACYRSECFPTASVTTFETAAVTGGSIGAAKRVMKFDPDERESPFSKVEDIVVALVAEKALTSYSLSLTRDPCATLNCTYGTCDSALKKCVCDQWMYGDNVYGWTGTLCNSPACPLNCNGVGTCEVPTTADAAGEYEPYCKCDRLYTGVACDKLNIPGESDEFSMAAAVTAETATDANSNSTGAITLPFDVNVGQNITFSSSTMPYEFTAVYIKLTHRNPGADPMLFVRSSTLPDMSRENEHFDLKSWTQRSGFSELSFVAPREPLFITVMNGQYGTARLQGEIVLQAGEQCPFSLRGCSGHGRCVGTCECDGGWEGLRCETPVPRISSGDVMHTSTLAPGEWEYFMYEAETSVHIDFTLVRESVSFGSQMLMMVGKATRSPPTSDRDRMRALATDFDGTRLNRVIDESAIFDFDGFASRADVQRLTMRRVAGSSSELILVGVHNPASARANLQAALQVTGYTTVQAKCAAGQTSEECGKDVCRGRGNAELDKNGVVLCQCTSGWNTATHCATPMFAEFRKMPRAAQNIGFLCNLCDSAVTLPRHGMVFYKIPQPLQKATGLQLDVGPGIVAGRRLQSTAGNPSLLVSETLPRSILDFTHISSSSNPNESIALTESSSTGRYWLALYANSPGDFQIRASRKALDVQQREEPSFLDEMVDWLFASQTGIIVLVMGGVLLSCICTVCICQNCAPSCAKKSKLLKDDPSLKSTRRLINLPPPSPAAQGSGGPMAPNPMQRPPSNGQPSPAHIAAQQELARLQGGRSNTQFQNPVPPSGMGMGMGMPPPQQQQRWR